MGYYRDASHFSRVSLFYAEMRRRVWCVLFMMDAGASAQFGLPRMVRASQSNTAELSSLLDEDIQEDMCELPSARPEAVRTPIQYFVAKNRLISVSGKISDLKTLTPSLQYAEILRLDEVLHSTYDNIPPPLAMRPMSKSIMDDSTTIIERIHMAIIFNKAKCNLHRPYLILAKADKRYTHSRTACVGAALEILHIQQVLDQETQAGGRLYANRGKVTSVMRGDFLLATTILCVNIHHTITQGSFLMSQNPASNPKPSQIVTKALQDAYLIWLRSSGTSREAQQAARALKIVLDKTKAMKEMSSVVSAGTLPNLPAINTGSDPQTTTAPVLTSERANAVNAILMAGTPISPTYLLGSDPDSLFDFNSMDFEMVSGQSSRKNCNLTLMRSRSTRDYPENKEAARAPIRSMIARTYLGGFSQMIYPKTIFEKLPYIPFWLFVSGEMVCKGIQSHLHAAT